MNWGIYGIGDGRGARTVQLSVADECRDTVNLVLATPNLREVVTGAYDACCRRGFAQRALSK